MDAALKSNVAVTGVAGRVAALRCKAGDEVVPLGVVPFPSGPLYYRGAVATSYDWVLVRLADDPLYRARELSIPAPVRRKLERLHTAGADFDDLLIAHEVPRGAIGSAQPKADDVAAAIRKAPVRPSSAAKLLGSTTRGLTAGIAAPFVALGTALSSIAADPVLIGVIAIGGEAKPGEPVAVFEIARW
jgi:hypothetical protein